MDDATRGREIASAMMQAGCYGLAGQYETVINHLERATHLFETAPGSFVAENREALLALIGMTACFERGLACGEEANG